MQAVTMENDVIRRFASGHMFPMAKLVLETAFQPIVEATTGTIFGYESLMRGHDRLGFSNPLALLDQAAQGGELKAFEQMLASRALAKFSTLPDFSSATLFLNLDVRLISQGDAILDKLVGHLARAGIPASSICFELSERFDNTSVPEFTALIARMRKEGFKLAIDDFGAGHGEMKLLCDFPLDYLKIDRHFINGVDHLPRKQHLVRNIVNIAHVLGVRVIAEGIETEAEFLTCREFSVDLVQGWLIAKPTVFTSELPESFPHLNRIGTARRSSQTLDEILIRREIERLPTVYEHDSVDNVFELFRRNPQQAFFPVLNANGEPRGVINEYHLKEYIYRPFGRDLLKNKIYERTISHFVDPAPIVGLDADADQLMNMFASMGGSACIILTENMRYAGIVSAASLIKVINEKQLKMAQDQNPLTALPGNRAIGGFIADSCSDGDETRFFCYCDFDNFKPFNDKYGFNAGDHAITLFSALIRRYFFAGDCFLGHIGGDDFFIGVRDWTVEELTEILERLLSDFHDDVAELYSPEDRQAGRMAGLDRRGNERDFALLRCSIGVLTLPKGLEIAGEVIALGEGVTEFIPGDKICALANGGYAEYCTVPAGQALPFPKGYDAVKAAALPETFFTVWANLFQMAGLTEGETVLIHGGTSGIGTTAIQLAKAFGVEVYATAGSAEKCEACMTLGAKRAINYREEDFAAVIKTETGGKGVDVVLDMIGAAYFEKNLSALAKDGCLSIIAFLGGAVAEKVNLTPIMVKRLTVTGSTMRPRTADEKRAIRDDLIQQVWPLVESGQVAPVINRVFTLDEVVDAHRLMESGNHIGKIVMRVS